jgi:hypothetical protein
MDGWKIIHPFNQQRFTLTSLNRGTWRRRFESPETGRRQVSMNVREYLSHGEAVIRNSVGGVLRIRSRSITLGTGWNRQAIDKFRQPVRVDN